MALLFCMGTIFANDTPQPTKKLTYQITKMLQKYPVPMISDGTTAEVRLSVDSFGEIHVLSIQTTDENLEKFLMNAINEGILQRDSYKLGIVYNVPIEIAGEV